jgi:hypothetical protein
MVAQIRFNLRHWSIVRKNEPSMDTYVADVTHIRVLVPPVPDTSHNPRKRKIAPTDPFAPKAKKWTRLRTYWYWQPKPPKNYSTVLYINDLPVPLPWAPMYNYLKASNRIDLCNWWHSHRNMRSEYVYEINERLSIKDQKARQSYMTAIAKSRQPPLTCQWSIWQKKTVCILCLYSQLYTPPQTIPRQTLQK